MLIFSLICSILFIVYAALIGIYRERWVGIREYAWPRGGLPPGDGKAGNAAVSPGEAATPPVRISVIVPVRNEERQLEACLDSLYAQSYPKELYQVVVIDDHSTDRTWDLLNRLYYPEMFCLKAKLADMVKEGHGGAEHKGGADGKATAPGIAYKKMAIEAGIGLATGELIVTTDADCRFDPDWLRTIAGYYIEAGAVCIAGPVLVEPGDSLLGIFQSLDFLVLQGITGAALEGNLHTLGNGANLAYEKEAFYDVGGFQGVDALPSGDDMFLIYKIARRYPGRVRYLKARQAIVSTAAANGWKAFVNQRIRWASKADSYQDKRIFRILLIVWLVNLMFLILAITACFDHRFGSLLLLLFLLKLVIEIPFVWAVSGFFRLRILMGWFVMMQPIHMIYTVAFGLLGKFGRYRWKDRQIKK